VTRQGAGAFVADVLPSAGFVVDLEMSKSLDAAVGVLELRRAVEVEAAGLAAERATKSALRAMVTAQRAFEKAIAEGASAPNEDLTFHLAVARATGNPHFVEFLQYLGRHVIPRQRIDATGGAIVHTRRYLQRVAHLSRAIARYRSLREGTATVR
jgi:GntR family transcriptional regulator, transcriptional repressor for pyruvate dehydrogenase complex